MQMQNRVRVSMKLIKEPIYGTKYIAKQKCQTKMHRKKRFKKVQKQKVKKRIAKQKCKNKNNFVDPNQSK